MAAYIVELPSGDPGQKRADLFIVSAADADDAKAIAKDLYSEGADEAWDSATVTAIADVASNADDALVGYTFNVIIRDTAGANLESVSYTGTATNDTIDLIAAQLVILLNATASIANAAYASNVLTAAAGAGADDLGDHTLVVTVEPPVVNDSDGVQQNRRTAIPGYVGAITHEGLATADLDVTFAADAYVRPTRYANYLKR